MNNSHMKNKTQYRSTGEKEKEDEIEFDEI